MFYIFLGGNFANKTKNYRRAVSNLLSQIPSDDKMCPHFQAQEMSVSWGDIEPLIQQPNMVGPK